MINGISIGSKSFKTQTEACKALGCDYKSRGPRKGCFIPRDFKKDFGDKYHVWFPHLDGIAPSGWRNTLNQSGTEITEHHPDTAEVQKIYEEGKDWTYVTFARKYGRFEFVGVFRIANMTRNTITFERISTKFP